MSSTDMQSKAFYLICIVGGGGRVGRFLLQNGVRGR